MQKRYLRTLACLLLVFIAAEPAIGQELGRKTWKKRWLVSIAAVAAASAFDASSSVGRPELNPLLKNAHGQFNTRRAVAVKLGGLGTIVALQGMFGNRNPAAYKTSALINFASAGALSASGARNTLNSSR